MGIYRIYTGTGIPRKTAEFPRGVKNLTLAREFRGNGNRKPDLLLCVNGFQPQNAEPRTCFGIPIYIKNYIRRSYSELCNEQGD